MAQVTSPEELFKHELQDMYYAENMLTKVLPQLAQEASDRELERAFTKHLKETEKQIKNLDRVFSSLGESAQGQPCPGMEGIKREHDEFVEENGTNGGQLLDMFLTGAAARTEHYEIAGYTGLIEMARALKQRDAVRLLQENLKQEKDALKTVEGISKRLAKNGGNGASSSRASSRSSRGASSRTSSSRSSSASRSRSSARR
jgi:ferritin-like metal-binding protein YciE